MHKHMCDELGSHAGWSLSAKVGPVTLKGEGKMKKGGRQRLSSEVGTQMLALALLVIRNVFHLISGSLLALVENRIHHLTG